MSIRRQIKRSATLVLHILCLSPLVQQNILAINSVLNIKNDFPYLINKTNGRIIEPRDYLDFDNIYVPSDTYKQNVTAQSRNYFLLKAFDFANYFQSDYWHYSNYEDLLLSAHPVANKEKCSLDLHWIVNQLSNTSALFTAGEQHVNLMTLVDAFGRPEASTFAGHNYWLGDYNQCKQIQIELDRFSLEECAQTGSCQSRLTKFTLENGQPSASNRLLKTRYCIGKGHDKDWPLDDDYTPRISYKIGLCLPEACETLSFEHHAAEIEFLMRFNMPDYMKSRINLHEIYCLPDPRSPIRKLQLSSRIFLGFCLSWLIILVASTWLYKFQRRHRCSNKLARDNAESGQLKMVEYVNQLGLGITNKLDKQQIALEPPDICNKIRIESDSTSAEPNSINGQREVGKTTRLDGPLEQPYYFERFSNWLNESQTRIRLLRLLSISENMSDFHRPPAMLSTLVDINALRINLNALDCIKCLCCILVIFGHIVFIHMQHLTNIMHTVELSNQVPPRLLMAFFNFVDTFFIISGMLTTYFVFKRFNKQTFAKPLVWIFMIALRFVRLSSVYVVVFWFSKCLTVHLSDGPIWDYGTDKNSNKGLCINDHWWKTILYFGNYGTMQPLCVLPAWSIIVDSQYSLIMAPVLYVIFKNQKLAYTGLLAAVLAATTSMSHQLATQTATKTSDMAKVRLHVYPLISRFAAEFYNTTTNRIGPVAIGILGGHCLYLYETGSIKSWPRFMRGNGFIVTLVLHLFVLMMPTISLFTNDPMSTQETDIATFVICNAAIKPLWSVVNTILLLRLLTDLRRKSVIARLMSHNIWHSLGKLCFASYLIHYEIILILMKSRHDGYPQPNWMNMVREFSFVFLLSTIVAYFIYILFEAPVNRLVVMYVERSDKCRNDEAVRSVDE